MSVVLILNLLAIYLSVLLVNPTNWQGAKEIWYNTIEESSGSREIKSIGLHWVSKPK